MRAFASLLLSALICTGSSQALADKRVALVIGNSKYQHAPSLANPANDAAAFSLLLKGAGFDTVLSQENLGVSDLRRAVRDFTEQTRDADMAVIYYAGHGIEVGGINYLVPVDATLRRDIDVEDETVSLDRLLQVLEPAKRLRLVILDACRENPFTRFMSRTMASRTVGRGLARVEPVTSDTLIAFAAKAGSTAADGTGTHSPFTSALLKHVVTPGLDVRLALGRVRDEVLEKTANRQEPFVYGSLGGKTVTLASPAKEEQSERPIAGDPDAPAARDYEAAAKVGTKEAWEAFLNKHPTGFYSDLARSQRTRLDLGKVSAPKPEAKKEETPVKKKEDSPAKANEKSNRYSAANIACCLKYYRQYVSNSGNACRPETRDGRWNLGLRNWCTMF